MPKSPPRSRTPAKGGGGAVSQPGGPVDGAAVPKPKKPAKKRSKVFDIPREEIMRRCREALFCQFCGGEALALRDLMLWFGWTIGRLSNCSGVSRAMITGILQMKKIPTSNIKVPLVCCMGLSIHEFDLLVDWELAEMLPDLSC